jgi:uncharacterized protein YxjI
MRNGLPGGVVRKLQCPSCGKPIDADAKFCTSCGAKISDSATPKVTTASSGSQVFSGNEYIIEQKIAAIRDTFGIKDRNGNLLAYVKKKIVSWGPQFWFETPEGIRVGEMRGKVLTVRPTFEIYDSQGLVAVVKKKVMKLLGSEWWLEDNSGNELARIKGNITEHDFVVRGSSGSEVAQVHKKWVNIRDSYGIEIIGSEISPYVIVAYVIAMDHAEWKAGKGFAIGTAGIGLGSMVGDFGKP